jgi:hypothetical protein
VSTHLAVGTRLRSVVCSTEVIVVRVKDSAVVLECGGQPMQPLPATIDLPADAAPQPGLDTGSLIGKRYGRGDDPLEVLCTKAGSGTLSVAGVILGERHAKALPASD